MTHISNIITLSINGRVFPISNLFESVRLVAPYVVRPVAVDPAAANAAAADAAATGVVSRDQGGSQRRAPDRRQTSRYRRRCVRRYRRADDARRGPEPEIVHTQCSGPLAQERRYVRPVTPDVTPVSRGRFAGIGSDAGAQRSADAAPGRAGVTGIRTTSVHATEIASCKYEYNI